MNDKTAPVFVIATANDITALPPEFSRKGRWDELFYVNMPDAADREAIWDVQLRNFKRDPEKFNTAELARITEGFTGAEIAACVAEAITRAFDEGTEIDDIMLSAAVADTIPLSKTMAAELEHMQQWARGRCRPAAKQRDATTGARRVAA